MRGEFLDLSGARIYYYAAGTRGAGEPVVFLHGFPTSSHLWAEVVPLMPPGHRVVVIDLLGYGRSDRPLDRAVDVAGHAGRAVELLDELRIERACIVGHGIGGGIAQALAVRYSDRVARLCLIDSVAFDEWPTFAARLARATLPLTRFLPPEVFSAILRRDLAGGYRNPSRVAHSIDQYLRPFVSPEGRDALVAHIRALVSGETTELAKNLGTIRVPTAIMWGQYDRALPLSVAYRLQHAIHGATLDVITEACHFVPEEAPRQVADGIAGLLSRA